MLAILLIALVAVGFIMASLPKDNSYKGLLVMAHKSFGFIALILGSLAVIWSFINIKPNYPASMGRFTTMLATAIRLALYLIILIMPWSGYIMATTAGRTFNFFQLFTVPTLINGTPALGQKAYGLHTSVAIIAVIVVSIHILAAIKHQFIDKDNVLKRMWF
jgi:cytochrome b561